MFEEELKQMIIAIKEAMSAVHNIYLSGFEVKMKDDDSPVTTADLQSNKILRKELNVFKNIAWLSEEDKDNLERLNSEMVFVVDPLDGTQDFVNHDDSFAINLALVKDHLPVVSVIGFPFDLTYCYAVKGKGSYYVKDGKEKRLHVSNRVNNLIMVISKTHYLDSEKEVVKRHSSLISKVIASGASTKAYLISDGKADVSIRYTDKTKEWDTCAPDLLVKEAGGIFTDYYLNDFVYNKKDVCNHYGYCMFNKKENEILLK